MKKLFLSGVGIVGFLFVIGSANKDVKSSENSASTKPKVETVTLTRSHWAKGGFDNIMMLDFTVHNADDHAVKDFTIKCEHSGPSGTKIDSNSRTVYEIIPAHTSLSHQQFNMGFIHSQAVTSACRVTNYATADH